MITYENRLGSVYYIILLFLNVRVCNWTWIQHSGEELDAQLTPLFILDAYEIVEEHVSQ